MNSSRTFLTETSQNLRPVNACLITVSALFFLIAIFATIPATADAQLAFAHIQADGTIDHDSGNVTVVKVNSGLYCIGVAGGGVSVAVVSLDSLPNLGGTVQAGVFFASGCPDNASDIVAVTRPQAQDGGVPGEDRAFYIVVY